MKFLMSEKRIRTAFLLLLAIIALLQVEGKVFFLLGIAGGAIFLPFLERAESREEGDSVIKSVLFQSPLAALALFAAATGRAGFGQGFILSLLAQSLIQQIYSLKKTGSILPWFWPIKGGVSPRASYIYLAVILAIFLYSLWLLR